MDAAPCVRAFQHIVLPHLRDRINKPEQMPTGDSPPIILDVEFAAGPSRTRSIAPGVAPPYHHI
jgi:hypothetical protein